MKYSRLKFGGINPLLVFFGLSYLVACGGGGSSGPQLELSTEAIQAIYVLGSAPVITDIALRNSGDELLTFSLTGPPFWLSAANATSGEIVPGREAIIQFTSECSAPGDDITGSLTISGNFGSGVSIAASLRCQVPPITVTLNGTIPDSAGHPRLNAQSEMQWSIASTWNGQPAVDYAIVASNERATVSPASGSVGLDDTVVTSLDVACPAPSDQGVELQIAAGDGLLDVVWGVNCQGGSGAVRRVELYQGPMAMREVYAEDASGEADTFMKNTFVDLIPNRDSVATVRVEHETDYLGEPAFSIVDGTGTSHRVEIEILSSSDPDENDSGNYETEFMFHVSGSLFEPESTLRADIDVDGSGDGPAREHVLALNDLSFFDTPLVRVRFSRLENVAGIPELESLDPFMNSLMNYMPVSDVEMTAAGIINHDVDSDWNVSIALEELLDHWLENAEEDEYYHGIYYPPRRNTPLGAAYVSGKVSISLYTPHDGLPTDHYVFAHGMGHNFSLQHAPCGGTSDVDPNYPYSDSRLGPRRGWKFLEDRFVDREETYYDLMSFCDPTSVSDYNFGKAAQYLEASARLVTQHLKMLTSNTGDYVPLTRAGKRAQSLALSGHVDDQGQWSFRGAVYSDQKSLLTDRLEVHSHIVHLFDVNGKELSSQSFSPMAIAYGTSFGWGVRIAIPASKPVELVVTDLNGIDLLRDRVEL